MTGTTTDTCEEVEAHVIWWAARPITFKSYLDLNVHNDMELVTGVMVKTRAAQGEHAQS